MCTPSCAGGVVLGEAESSAVIRDGERSRDQRLEVVEENGSNPGRHVAPTAPSLLAGATLPVVDDVGAADLELAHRMADSARTTALQWFEAGTGERHKPDGTPVSDADLAVEEGIRQLLTVERPDDALLCEERRARYVDAPVDHRWDRRQRRVPGGSFGVGGLLALETDGDVMLGIVDQPVRRERVWAVRNQGAFIAESDDRVSAERLRECGRPLVEGPVHVPASADLTATEQRVAWLVAGAATRAELRDRPDLAVARGRCVAAMFHGCGPWDLAAGKVIVEEAGGALVDLPGGDQLTPEAPCS